MISSPRYQGGDGGGLSPLLTKEGLGEVVNFNSVLCGFIV